MSAIFLGTSGAWPTPRPGCDCPQCAEARADARLRRTRSSLLIRTGTEVVLVDPGPDVWHQFEREGLEPRVDRVLVTHTHADHCLGLDDLVFLRADRRDHPLRVHAAAWHQERLGEIFPHLLRGSRPGIVLDSWEPGSRLEVGGWVFEGFETGHGDAFPTTAPLLTTPAEGGRRSRIAYATDMGLEMPPESLDLLRGVDLLVGDGSFLGGPGHGHPGTEAVIRLGRDLGAGRVAFTHLGHLGLSDADLRLALGDDVGLARDGLEIGTLLGT